MEFNPNFKENVIRVQMEKDKERKLQEAESKRVKDIIQASIPESGGFVEFSEEPKQKPVVPLKPKEYSLGLTNIQTSQHVLKAGVNKAEANDEVEEVLPPSINEQQQQQPSSKKRKRNNKEKKVGEDAEYFNGVFKKLKTNIEEVKKTQKLENVYVNLSSGEEEEVEVPQTKIDFKNKVNQLKGNFVEI